MAPVLSVGNNCSHTNHAAAQWNDAGGPQVQALCSLPSRTQGHGMATGGRRARPRRATSPAPPIAIPAPVIFTRLPAEEQTDKPQLAPAPFTRAQTRLLRSHLSDKISGPR
jgi:hypothetical protein